MKHKYRIFKDKNQLDEYTKCARNEKILKHLNQSDTLESVLEPYQVWFGTVNQRFMRNMLILNQELLKAKIKFHISYIIFAIFFYFIFNNKEHIESNIYTLVMFIFIPFLLAAYFPTRLHLDLEAAEINAALMKEQALAATMIFDELYKEDTHKQKLFHLTGESEQKKEMLTTVFNATIYYFLSNTRYNNWIKDFVVRNYEIFVNGLLNQHNSNSFLTENYKSIYRHVIPKDDESEDVK